MKNYKSKILALLATSLMTSSVIAATASATLNVSANILEGCTFASGTYSANFGVVAAGSVGDTSVNIGLQCSSNATYSLAPLTDVVSYVGALETVYISAFSDSGRTTKLTVAAPWNQTATVVNDTRNIYFRVNGAPGKTDLGKGPVLSAGQSITIVYPLVLTY
jgi:spore coat protein U-like protein